MHFEQNEIYLKWDEICPSLQIAISGLQSPPPILQAVIIGLAPRRIIVDIIGCFDCIYTRGSFGRYPIDVAREEGLEWSEGMQDVVEVTAAKHQCPVIHAAAQYGLPWSNYMRELVKSNVEEVTYGTDNTTGLAFLCLLQWAETVT